MSVQRPPSNAAQLLVPDRQEIIRAVQYKVQSVLPKTERVIDTQIRDVAGSLERALDLLNIKWGLQMNDLDGCVMCSFNLIHRF